jgi:catechol 2,3-dioxygenase-like lactoylglutathione lyase family enzyme
MEPSRASYDARVGVLRIEHVQLAMPAGEEDAARAFYVHVLGLEEVAKPPVLAGRGGAWFTGGAAHIHLGVDPDFRPARKAHPALVVDDLDGLAERLRKEGHPVRPDEPFGGLRRLHTEDPFGNRIELMQPMP